jgi:hypothetical protein
MPRPASGAASKPVCTATRAGAKSPLWQYAVFAVVFDSRAAAERLGLPLEEIARRIAAWHHLDLSNDGGPR